MDQEFKKMIKPTSSNMTFLLPLDLKQEFARVCSENDTTASQKIRLLMSWYIQKNSKKE